MANSRGRTFWATIDRISDQGNGVVERNDGGHFIVGPVRAETVGKTVEVRMVGSDKAELVNSDLRKDIFAKRSGSKSQALSEGEVVSGRILKRTGEGIPVFEKEGVRIEVPGAELNEAVKVKLEEVSGSNSQWAAAIGRPVDDTISSNSSLESSIVADTELYNELPIASPGTVPCPVSDCGYSGHPASVAGHVSGKRDPQHDWNQLGFAGANAYKRSMSTAGRGLRSSTTLLHISDSHLGASLSETGDYDSNSRCHKGFRRAIDFAVDREVDAVLNTGDLFHNDRRGIPIKVKESARDQLKRLAKHDIPFYSIDGDHERETGREVLRTFEQDELVIQLSESPHMVGSGLALYGRDFTPAKGWESTAWSPTPPPTDRFGIAAIHQSIRPISNSDWPDCTVADIVTTVGSHVHAIAAGHLHRTGIDWNDGLPFILGGTTEPQRARQASIKPVVGLFTQDGNSLRYQRVQLTI